jgi:hypothetical protein
MNLVFLGEMERTTRKVRDEILGALQAVNVSDEVCKYVSGCHLYFKAPFLLTAWQLAPEMRERLAVDMGMHIMSLKLGDDLVDNDMSADRLSLGVGSLQLSHVSLQRMCGYLDPAVLLPLLSDSMAALCRAQILATRSPATTLGEWRERAEGYGGGFLRIYANVATLAGDAPAAADSARRFATGFGNLITLADDLRDYKRTGERAGNLAALAVDGRVSVDDILAFVNDMRDTAVNGCTGHPTAFDLTSVVDFFVSDIVSRMIPTLREQSTAGQTPAG